MEQEKKVFKATEVEWTNPLTGDGEYCTIEFSADDDGSDVTLVSVLWERTQEECTLRYISSDVKEELIQSIESMIMDGDFEEFVESNADDSED